MHAFIPFDHWMDINGRSVFQYFPPPTDTNIDLLLLHFQQIHSFPLRLLLSWLRLSHTSRNTI